jgi:hypothetical protein
MRKKVLPPLLFAVFGVKRLDDLSLSLPNAVSQRNVTRKQLPNFFAGLFVGTA